MKPFIFIAMLFCSLSLFSQNSGSINGTLFDEEFNNEPLAFATVSIKGTGLETTANINGTYTFEDIKPGKHVLVYSFVGYKTKELVVEVKSESTSTINVNMGALKPVMDPMITSESSKSEPLKNGVSMVETKA